MLAEHAAGVLAVRPCLAAEALCVGGEPDREIALAQRLARVQVGEWDLGGGHQIQRALVHPCLEQIGLELGELPGARHRLGRDEVRNVVLLVAVPAGVQIEKELGERPLQLRARTAHHREPGPGQLGGSFEVQDSERLTEVNMILRFMIEDGRSTPAAYLLGEVVGVTIGRPVLGQVGYGQQERVQLRFQRGCGFVAGLHVLLQLASLRLGSLDVLSGASGLLDVLGRLVRLRPQLIGVLDRFAASREEFLKPIGIQHEAAAGKPTYGICLRIQQDSRVMHTTRTPSMCEPRRGGGRSELRLMSGGAPSLRRPNKARINR